MKKILIAIMVLIGTSAYAVDFTDTDTLYGWDGAAQFFPTYLEFKTQLDTDLGFVAVETDPVFITADSFGISTADIANWDSKEPALGNPGVDGYILSSTAAGVRSWVIDDTGSGTVPPGTDGQVLQFSGTTLTAVDGLSNVAFNLGGDVSNLLYSTGINWLLDTDTTVNHVLSASKIISLDATVAATAANADNITSGTVADARIPSTVARDSELLTVISGTSTMGTAEIASGACAMTVTTTATGAATTDVISGNFNASPLAVTGYAASADGGLHIVAWPTANNVNFSVCNNTAAAITPGAITLNWQVIK